MSETRLGVSRRKLIKAIPGVFLGSYYLSKESKAYVADYVYSIESEWTNRYNQSGALADSYEWAIPFTAAGLGVDGTYFYVASGNDLYELHNDFSDYNYSIPDVGDEDMAMGEFGDHIYTCGHGGDDITRSYHVSKLVIPDAKEWEVNFSPTKCTSVDVNDSDGYVYAGNAGGDIYILDVADGTVIDSISPFTDVVSALEVSPGNTRFFAVSLDGFVRAFSSNYSLIWEKDLGKILTSVGTNPNLDSIFIGTRSGELIALNWDGTDYWSVTPHTDEITGVTVDPDGDRVYTGSLDSEVAAFDSTDGTELWRNAGSSQPVQDIASKIVTEPNVATPTATATPRDEPADNEGIFSLWDNNLAVIAAVIGAYGFIGAWSRSLTLAAWGAYLSFLYIAFESQIQLFENIGLVTLVLVMVGFAFKFYRSEIV